MTKSYVSGGWGRLSHVMFRKGSPTAPDISEDDSRYDNPRIAPESRTQRDSTQNL